MSFCPFALCLSTDICYPPLENIISSKNIVIFAAPGNIKTVFKKLPTEALKWNLETAKPQLRLSRLVHFIKGTVMCLVAKCVEIKKKYSNLIRERNMIIFIDRRTTRRNYPKLCLSDNAVSFSTLVNTAAGFLM